MRQTTKQHVLIIKNKNKYMNKKKELWKVLLLSAIIFAPL